MINGQTDYEKYKVLRPIYSDHKYDQYGFPIIKKEEFDYDDWSKTRLCNFKNIKGQKEKEKSIVIMFNYDNIINKVWDDPHRYLIKLLGFKALCTPDFSIYPGMNINDIRHNIYKNRWTGCMWQEKGYKVIPTIQWADEDTYDMCFSGVEKGSVVIVSTLGCTSNSEVFLKGFNKMKEVIEPSLIIVFGKMLTGMTGTFLQFDYKDCFVNKIEGYEQLRLFPVDSVFTIEGSDYHG